MGVVFYNGVFIDETDVSISSNNRAFNYGDGFFETVKIINSKPFNFPCNFKRIKLALTILKLDDNYTSVFFEEKIFYLIKVNGIINGSIKIHICRSGAGRYFPKSDQSDLFINSSIGYAFRQNDPISLCFYDVECKGSGSLSNIKSVNSLVSVLGSIHAKENDFDNAILLNNSGNIIEVANSNIFIVKNDRIYTPPLTEGCVDGTMRKWVMNEQDVSEKVMLKNEILIADEVFITNAISGITPVNTIVKTYFISFNTANHVQQKLINSSLGL